MFNREGVVGIRLHAHRRDSRLTASAIADGHRAGVGRVVTKGQRVTV